MRQVNIGGNICRAVFVAILACVVIGIAWWNKRNEPIAAPVGRAAAARDAAACAVFLARKASHPRDLSELLDVAENLGARRGEQADRVLSHVTGVITTRLEPRDRPYKFHAVARIYARLDMDEKAAAVLSRAVATARALPRGERARLGVAGAARRYMKMGRLERARELIQSIGVPPADKKRHRQEDEELKAGYLAILAHEYLQAGDKTKCLKLLSEACRYLTRLRSLYQYQHHWHAIRSLRVVDVYLAAGRIERALEVAGNIKATLHPGIDQGEARYSPVRFKIIATITIGNELALEGARNRAGQVLVQAYKLARDIDHRYLKSQMLKDVALAFAGAGRYAYPAGRLISEPEKLRPAPDLERGLKVAREVPHPVLKSLALRMVGKRCLKAGKKGYALQILAEAQAVVEAINEDSREATAYGMGFREHTKRSEMLAMAEVFHGAGEEEMAFGILEELTKAETAREPDTERVWPLLDIARRYLAFDRRDLALDVLGKAVRIATDQGATHNPKVACTMARVYMQCGRVEKGFGLLQPIVAKAQGGETFGSMNLVRTARWLGENRHYEKARLVAGAIAHDAHRDSALKHLGVQLVQGSRYEEALEMTIEIRSPADAAEVVAAVAAAYSEPGQEMSDRARNSLRTIVKKWNEDGMDGGKTGTSLRSSE